MIKRFTTVELSRPNPWGIWYDGAVLSTYQICHLLNEYVDVKTEAEQLKSENIHIKTLIDDALQNERTEIGKSVLRQLKEALE